MINIVEEHDHTKWDDLIREHKGSVFISSQYLDPLKNECVEPIYLKIYDNDELIGCAGGLSVLSQFIVFKKLRMFKSFEMHSGPLVIKENTIQIIIENLIEYSKNKGYSKFTDLADDQTLEIKPIDNIQILKNDEYLVDLEGGMEKVHARMSRGIRRKIIKGRSNDLSFSIEKDPKYIKDLERLMRHTGKDRSERGFESFLLYYLPHLDAASIKEQLKNGVGRFGLIKKDDKVISIQYFIFFNDRANAIYMGSDDDGYNLEANALVYYGIMEQLCQDNCRYFYLGGTPREGRDGLVQFKSGLGGKRLERWGVMSPFLQGKFMETIYDLYRALIELYLKYK